MNVSPGLAKRQPLLSPVDTWLEPDNYFTKKNTQDKSVHMLKTTGFPTEPAILLMVSGCPWLGYVGVDHRIFRHYQRSDGSEFDDTGLLPWDVPTALSQLSETAGKNRR